MKIFWRECCSFSSVLSAPGSFCVDITDGLGLNNRPCFFFEQYLPFWENKDCLNRSKIFPKTIFAMTSILHFCYNDLIITNLPALHCNTFTGIVLCFLSFVAIPQILGIMFHFSVFSSFCLSAYTHMSWVLLCCRNSWSLLPMFGSLSLSQTDNFPAEPNYMGSRQQFVQR